MNIDQLIQQLNELVIYLTHLEDKCRILMPLEDLRAYDEFKSQILQQEGIAKYSQMINGYKICLESLYQYFNQNKKLF